jgi:Tol biopolymer transport system component
MHPPESFPHGEIVFQRGGHSLGFVDADGSVLTVVELRALLVGWQEAAYPVWSPDGSTVVFRAGENPGGGYGDLIIIRAGREVLHCPDKGSLGMGRVSFLGTDKVVATVWNGVDDLMQVALINLEDCQVIRSYLDEAEVLGTSAITQDGQWLALEKRVSDPLVWDIMVLDLASGQETVVGKGCCPSWSPDGRWLAYTGEDYGEISGMNLPYPEGIYLISRDNGQKSRLVSFPKTWWGWEPAPSWSPDGQWLVYHRCMRKWCSEDVTEYSIFKVHVETGEEVKILDGGVNPYWRQARP